MPDVTLTPAAPSIDRTMGTYKRARPIFEFGKGAWITDSDGRRYLDLISGIGASCLGHGHAGLAAALGDQASKLGHVSNLYRHGVGEALSSRLCEKTGMDVVFFCNSGSEANEAALKLARKHHAAGGHGHRQRFVALNGGFHGRTFGSLSVTSNPAYREPFGRALEATFIDPGDFDALNAVVDDQVAAVIMEPIQGEGGLKVLCDRYLRAVREACDRAGALLILDEIQSGAGRTGDYLASSASGVVPDIVTLAKPLGAGLPIGAMLARGDYAATLVPGDHGSTFGGGTLACRAAMVVLDELDGGLQARVRELGAKIEALFDDLAERHDHVIARRGSGLMQGLVVPGRAGEVVQGLMDEGVLSCTATPHVVRFLPPFILTDSDLAHGAEVIDRVLGALPASA